MKTIAYEQLKIVKFNLELLKAMDNDHITFNIPSKSEQLKVLLNIIHSDYFDDVNNWKFIGECIKNISGNKGYELFVSYTPEDRKNSAEGVWKSLKKSRYGIRTVKWIAEKTNKEKFKTWRYEIMFAAGIGTLKRTAGMTEIADIAHFLYDYKTVCTSVLQQVWWNFNGSCWERMSGGESIKQKFSREMALVFESIYDDMVTMDQDNKDVKDMTKKAADITKGLKDPGPKVALMRECSEIFYVRDFESNADEDHYILGFPNGVLVMRDFKNVHFRPAYPDDMITLQMGAEYHPEIYSSEHPDVKFMSKYKRQVLPDDEVRQFSLRHKGSCLMGGNKQKWNVINIGETAHNGKSTEATLDRQTFGTYSGKLPLGAVSGATPKMNEVNPALVATKGTRLQQIDEASKKQEFNAAFMKLAAGNDEQTGRRLYSDGVTFLPQFNLIMYCNSAPTRLDSAGDAGMDERDVLIPHNSRFTFDAPENEELQWKTKTFKADPHIKNELKARIDAYLWILVESLKEYLEFGLKKPQSVIDKTDQYHYANNPYKQFIKDKLENTTRQVDYITLLDLYANYKLWYADSFPNKRLENKEDFSVEIVKYMGETVGDDKRFHGYKIKSETKRFDRGGK